jgi:hypothetical protein
MTFSQIQNSLHAQLHLDDSHVEIEVRCFDEGNGMMTKKRTSAKRTSEPTDYCRDFKEWPQQWMVVDADLKTGRDMLASFTVFVRSLINAGLAAKTIKNHMHHLNLLGSEIVRQLNDGDESHRKLPSNALLLKYIDDESGPLLPFWDPNDNTELGYHMAFDATCRKLYKFIAPF